MEASESAQDTWSLLRVLDLVGVALAVVVAAQVVGAVVASLDLSVPSNASGITAGPLPNPFGHVPLSERLDQATSWAGAGVALFLLGTLGLVALPRILWEAEDESSSRGWARPAVFIAGVLGALLAVAAALGAALLFWQPGGSGAGFQDVEIPLLVERITGVGMGLLVAGLSVLAVRVGPL